MESLTSLRSTKTLQINKPLDDIGFLGQASLQFLGISCRAADLIVQVATTGLFFKLLARFCFE